MPELNELEREERAFRAALERHAEAYRPTKVNPYVPVTRPWWPTWARVVAVLIVVAGGVGVLVHRGERQAEEGVIATSPGDGGTASPCAAGCVTSSLPPAAAGWHWVSWHDVAVQVPDSWGWGSGSNGFGCVTKPPKPDTPYVALDPTYETNGGVGCTASTPQWLPAEMADADPGVAEPADWRPNLAFGAVPRSYPEGYLKHFGTWHYGDWTFTRRLVGGTSAVALLSRDSDHATAARVLASARTFTTDQNGCSPRLPVTLQPAVWPEPSGRDVVSVSICQYDRRIGSGPSLMGSRVLEGRQASRLAEAIASAPGGSGPNQPHDVCGSGFGGDTVVDLIEHGDANATERILQVHYDGCSGNGIDDEGPQHRLTRADCAPIFAEFPIVLGTVGGPVGRACQSSAPGASSSTAG